MSFSVDLSHELYLKNVEDEARIQEQQPKSPQEEEEKQEPKFIFFDTEESDLVNKRSINNDNENDGACVHQVAVKIGFVPNLCDYMK